ncbi:MAG: 23S rRNA (guanosine(2251)-2'-O)-methyltransferase RlmB [Chitinophagaceae bacterium]
MKTFRQQQHRPKKSTLVVGRKLVIEALQSGQQLDRIYLQNNAGGETIDFIKKLAGEYLVPVNKVPVEKLNSFNINHHEGCVGIISKIQYLDLQQVISFVVEKGQSPFFIILDGITDIRNIGGIARTALCCGVQAIIIPEKGVGALQEDAILTSAGALEKIAVCRVNSLVKAIDDLHLNGIKVLASDINSGNTLLDTNFKEPCAVVLGSEEKGIAAPLLKISDASFKIPMQAAFDSLNVSVATGIILFEAMKQRNFNQVANG